VVTTQGENGKRLLNARVRPKAPLPMTEDVSRIERKVDALTELVLKLVDMLAEEEDQPGTTLDGEPNGQERDQSQGLS
jgi:hypothetical protein